MEINGVTPTCDSKFFNPKDLSQYSTWIFKCTDEIYVVFKKDRAYLEEKQTVLSHIHRNTMMSY